MCQCWLPRLPLVSSPAAATSLTHSPAPRTEGLASRQLHAPPKPQATCSPGACVTLLSSCLALGRPYYLTRQKPLALPSPPRQQALVLVEPKRKPSTFWHSISRLAPFRK